MVSHTRLNCNIYFYSQTYIHIPGGQFFIEMALLGDAVRSHCQGVLTMRVVEHVNVIVVIVMDGR